MTIEGIEQAAKTIVESAYEYESALEKKDKKQIEKTRRYLLDLCKNVQKMVEEEKKNA